jgi:hypothetical protein
MASLTPFIVTVTFEAGAAHRDFSERFETLSEAYAEMARAMDDVRQIAIDFRLSECSKGNPMGSIN